MFGGHGNDGGCYIDWVDDSKRVSQTYEHLLLYIIHIQSIGCFKKLQINEIIESIVNGFLFV